VGESFSGDALDLLHSSDLLGRNALHAACFHGHLDCARELLRCESDLVDRLGITDTLPPLNKTKSNDNKSNSNSLSSTRASSSSSPSSLLPSTSSSVSSSPSSTSSPSHPAASEPRNNGSGQVEADGQTKKEERMLLVSMLDFLLRTPLHYAIYKNQPEIVALLLDHDALMRTEYSERVRFICPQYLL
jgi:ankyrin repeat protein